MKFVLNQLVKSSTDTNTVTVYRIVNIDHNLYTVEDDDGGVDIGCDDDFDHLKNTDPLYWNWVEKSFR